MRFQSVLVYSLVLCASAMAQSTQTAPSQAAKPVQNPPSSSAAAPAAEPRPEHPITADQVHELMQLTGADRIKTQMLQSMLAYFQRLYPPYFPKDVIDDLNSSVEKVDLEPVILEAYQKRISTEDAVQIIAFYKTPAGQHVVGAMPAVFRDIQQSGGQLGMQVSKEVFDRHKAEIEAAAQEYRKEHSPASAPSLTTPPSTPNSPK